MKTVLVVDDSATVRHAIRRILESCGHAVVEAADGLEALAVCRGDEALDLILLDLDMPVMNGIEFLRALDAVMPTRRPPVVMCTTDASFDMIGTALAAGASDYIMKPFDAGIIEAKLTTVGAS